ncbi:pentatricopeptide repeat-containing protein At2g45350, chloroplastic-like [Papaver somniferum]|nr:pentatricopeptide repeat-containing protein At2g45350, chloroplastic-like [Papaver somniferum]
MRKESILPSNFTFPFVLRAFEEQFELQRGEEVHGCILKTGFGSNLFVLTTLLNMYSLCGRSSRASTKVFEEMHVKDVVSWNSMISGHLRHGELELARRCFDMAPDKTLVSWNSMVAGFANSGNTMIEAERLFMEMPATSWNSLIKVGDVLSAERLFERMPERVVVSWTLVIRAMYGPRSLAIRAPNQRYDNLFLIHNPGRAFRKRVSVKLQFPEEFSPSRKTI